MEVNVEAVRALREALRRQLPELERPDRISNETLSAALALASEVLTIRLIQAVADRRPGPVGPEEAVSLMDEAAQALYGAMAGVLLKYAPDMATFRWFKPRPKKE